MVEIFLVSDNLKWWAVLYTMGGKGYIVCTIRNMHNALKNKCYSRDLKLFCLCTVLVNV